MFNGRVWFVVASHLLEIFEKIQREFHARNRSETFTSEGMYGKALMIAKGGWLIVGRSESVSHSLFSVLWLWLVREWSTFHTGREIVAAFFGVLSLYFLVIVHVVLSNWHVISLFPWVAREDECCLVPILCFNWQVSLGVVRSSLFVIVRALSIYARALFLSQSRECDDWRGMPTVDPLSCQSRAYRWLYQLLIRVTEAIIARIEKCFRCICVSAFAIKSYFSSFPSCTFLYPPIINSSPIFHLGTFPFREFLLTPSKQFTMIDCLIYQISKFPTKKFLPSFLWKCIFGFDYATVDSLSYWSRACAQCLSAVDANENKRDGSSSYRAKSAHSPLLFYLGTFQLHGYPLSASTTNFQ